MDALFSFQPVIISDDLVALGATISRVPVTVFLTSVAEPASKAGFRMPDAMPDVAVEITGRAMRQGDTGFTVIHTSAGLRAYRLGPVQGIPELPTGTRGLIDRYCDSFHVLRRAVDIQELLWVEPPPDYGWSFDPLRQWQIVLDRVPLTMAVAVHDLADETIILAGRADFDGNGERAAVELVTDAKTDLLLRVAHAGAKSRYAVSARWLLPLHRHRMADEVTGIAKHRRRLFAEIGGCWVRVDQASGEMLNADDATIFAQSIDLNRGSVAVIHEGELVIARAASLLNRIDHSYHRGQTGTGGACGCHGASASPRPA
jgi:hypothetical protein